MMKKKGLFFVVLVIILIIGVAFFLRRGQSNQIRDFFQIEESGMLNIVTDYNSIGYYVSGDTVSGFNHDLIQLLKLYTPLNIEVHLETSIDKSLTGLEQGKYDIIAQNIPTTSVLKDSLNFTEVITQSRQVLIQRKTQYNNGIEPIRSHLNLAKKTLYIPANSPAKLRIENLSYEIGDTIYIKEDPVYGSEQLIMMVALGDIDYAVCDELIAANVSESLPEIDYATQIGFTHLEAWVVRKNTPVLLDSLNTWIREIKDTKAYNDIYMKYYGKRKAGN